ncbi:MAG: glycosyl transferase family 2 [Bacteroidetes bacterium CG2_30_33_31]|nr:MAG: glycosyl transferase family 2 [Bacteroidetes bacterium CG2_30_33_31]
MYSIQNISINFSGNELFRNINFLINEKDRIGLVGKNGAGKTSLLRVITGEMKPDSGQVIIPQDKTFGYLPQEMAFEDTKSILDEALSAFEENNRLELELENLNNYFVSSTDYESTEYYKKLDRLHHINERLLILNAGSSEGEAEKVLLGLGFERSNFQNPTSSLSGGWRMRVELAKIILKKPELLLLDEPTNHLDIESIQWLESFLSAYPGAIVLISHDRSFLDNITNRTVEISLGRIRDYKFAYSKYVEVRQAELDQNQSEFTNQQKKIKEIEDFIDRFRYKATKAKQVQSRIKMLGKMDKVELELTDKSAMHFRFPPAPPSGKISLEIKNYSKKYGDKTVLKNVDLVILKNEFIAFVGKNGEGKSTLVKSIVNQIEFEGEIKKGFNVEIGYYGQNQTDLLDLNLTVFETIDDIAVGDIRKNIRAILGSFLFGENDMDKRVKVLSGGEKARLALAKLLLKPVNLLILDEPTNHLDMISKDILKSALLQYTGTLILVSHDRDFLSGLSDKTYEFRHSGLIEYLGGIDLFLEKRSLENLKLLESTNKSAQQNIIKNSTSKLSYQEKKDADRIKRKVAKDIERSEAKIASIEEKMALTNKMLANPDGNNIDLNSSKIYEDYKILEKEFEIEMEKWENLHEQFEKINQE